MTNPKIETDIGEIFLEIKQELRKIDERLNKLEIGQETIKGEIKTIDEKLSGQIKAVDEKLSGQIKAVDEKLSGQIKAIDVKVEQLDKRVGNVEFSSRGILIGIGVVILGGLAMLFGFGKP